MGRAYWLAVAPFHRFVFPDMIEGIARDAERGQLEAEAAESIDSPTSHH